MKTISDYLNNLNEKLDLSGINPDSKDLLERKIIKKREELEKVIKKMDLGDLKYEIYPDRICFNLGRRYDFWIELERYLSGNSNSRLRVSSIASYGNFYQDDECWKFYKSLGVLLSQHNELDKLREILIDLDKLLKLKYKYD